LHIDGITLDSSASLRVIITAGTGPLLSHRDRKPETLMRLLRFFRLNVGIRNVIAEHLDEIIGDPTKLAPYMITMAPQQARALCEILFDAGLHYIADTFTPDLIVVWNNAEDRRLTYRVSHAYLCFGAVEANYNGGVAPRFARFIPPANRWSQGAQDEIVHRTQWHAQMDYANIFAISEQRLEESP
jgi:hypothetical protein